MVQGRLDARSNVSFVGWWDGRGSATRSLLCRALVTVGRDIVRERNGLMPLWDFSRRLSLRLGMPQVPLADLSDAVKATLEEVDDPRLRVLAPAMPGAGYVYDAADPNSLPVRQ